MSAETNASRSTPVSPPRAYVPQQFSEATQLILKRLRGEGGPLHVHGTLGYSSDAGVLQTPGYEDVRRSVLEGMKTTLHMDFGRVSSSHGQTKLEPTLPISVASRGNVRNQTRERVDAHASKKFRRASSDGIDGKRRKSAGEFANTTDDSTFFPAEDERAHQNDFESKISQPTQTLSGRNIVKPRHFNPSVHISPVKKRPIPRLKRTGRSVETALCKRCGRGHSPASNMIVFCDGCNVGWHQMCHDPMIVHEVIRDESREWFCMNCSNRKRSLKHSSSAVEPANSNVWQNKSLDDKRAYLRTIPHSRLVEILLHLSTSHPDFAASLANGSFGRQDQQDQTIGWNKGQAHRSQLLPEASPNTASVRIMSSNDPGTPGIRSVEGLQDHDEGSRASTPASPSYPRPGHGLMAKLKHDNLDLSWLVGEGEDEVAFAHVQLNQ